MKKIIKIAFFLFLLGCGAQVFAHTIAIAWQPPASGDPPTQYNIKRATTSGQEVTIATVPAPATNYTDATVNAGATYFYVVTASNAAGESAPSNEASGTIPLTKPGIPGALTLQVQ